MENENFYRRNLPHFQTLNANYFVTFRLAGSLPKDIIDKLKIQYENRKNECLKIKDLYERDKQLYIIEKKYFGTFDKLLDNLSYSKISLMAYGIPELILNTIHFRDKKEYNLISYCIMTNHIHMVFRLEGSNDMINDPYRVTYILQKLKGFTGHEANKILGRNGQFWNKESYDHVIRNEKEFRNIINYVINNPVKAGLVKEWSEWKWSYIAPDL